MNASQAKEILAAALPGAAIDVRDDTSRHEDHNREVGHFGAHFFIRVVWDGFDGMSRLERHRKIREALAAPWEEKSIHSLNLRLMSTREAAL